MHWRIAAVLPHLRGRVLDVGCGTNDLLKTYRQAGGQPRAADSVGVDVFDWPGADLLVGDSADLPYGDGSFDTVAIVAALNHIPNRAAVLRECRRLLRPGGRAVLTMLPPTLSWAWHQLRRPWDADQTERGMQPGEVWGLSRRQIDALLRGAGFEPTRRSRFMFGLNLLTLAEPAKVPAANGTNGTSGTNGTPHPAAAAPPPALAVTRRRAASGDFDAAPDAVDAPDAKVPAVAAAER